MKFDDAHRAAAQTLAPIEVEILWLAKPKIETKSGKQLPKNLIFAP